jgi:hypothetical protein
MFLDRGQTGVSLAPDEELSPHNLGMFTKQAQGQREVVAPILLGKDVRVCAYHGSPPTHDSMSNGRNKGSERLTETGWSFEGPG